MITVEIVVNDLGWDLNVITVLNPAQYIDSLALVSKNCFRWLKSELSDIKNLLASSSKPSSMHFSNTKSEYSLEANQGSQKESLTRRVIRDCPSWVPMLFLQGDIRVPACSNVLEVEHMASLATSDISCMLCTNSGLCIPIASIGRTSTIVICYPS